MNWVAVMIALTRFVKKVSLSYCIGPRSRWPGHGTFCSFGCLVVLVTCQPPTGCDMGTMTAWTFGASWGCSFHFTIVLLAGLGHCVWSCCAAVASDGLCDCSVACERCCPNNHDHDPAGNDQEILKVTGMEECNPNTTQTAHIGHGSDLDGAPFREKQQYSSMVGMPFYLSMNTHLDIVFAVSQVCQYNPAPKQRQGSTIKMIIRYLCSTVDCGIGVTPNGDTQLLCYVDVDFCGLDGCKPQDEPSSACSWSGHLFSYCGCPIHGKI